MILHTSFLVYGIKVRDGFCAEMWGRATKNIQDPTSKFQPPNKIQDPENIQDPCAISNLEPGSWIFSGSWSLDLGCFSVDVSSIPLHSTAPIRLHLLGRWNF